MAITFVGGTAASAQNGGDVTIVHNLLSLQADDLFIVAYAIGDNDSVDFDMAMVTAGYTEVVDIHAPTDVQDTDLGVFWKVLTDADILAESVVVDGRGGADAAVVGVAMAFRGVDTTTPMDVAPTTASGNNTNRPDPPSIDHLNPAGLWTVAIGAFGHANTVSNVTVPTNYNSANAETFSANDTSDITISMAYRTDPADPEDPGIFTPSIADNADHSWCAATLALRPSVAGTQYSQALTASVGFAGATGTRAGKALAAAASFSGLANRSARREITASASFSGATTKRLPRALTATTGFSGAFDTTKVALRSLAGAVGFSPVLARRASRSFTGGVGFGAALGRRASRALSASVGFTGAVARRMARAVTAGVSFAGAMTTNRFKGVSFTAAASFSGSVSRGASRQMTAAVSFAGAMQRLPSKALQSSVSFAGATSRRVSKSLTAALRLIGFFELPNEKIWNYAGTQNEPYSLPSTPKHFTMSDGAQIMLYRMGTGTASRSGYQLRLSNGTIQSWVDLHGAGAYVLSKWTRNGDTLYGLTDSYDQPVGLRLVKLVYAAGAVTQSDVKLSDATYGRYWKAHGLYWDPTNSLIHVHYYDGSTGFGHVRAYNSSLVAQYTSSDTFMTADPAYNAVAGLGGSTFFIIEHGFGGAGAATVKRVEATATAYTITAETGVPSTTGRPTAVYDGTNLLIFYLKSGNGTGTLELVTRAGVNTYTVSTLLSAQSVYANADAEGAAVHRKLSNNDLLVVFTDSGEGKIRGLKREGGVWETTSKVYVDDDYAVGGHMSSGDDLNASGSAYIGYNEKYPAPYGVGVKRITSANIFTQALSAAVGFTGGITRRTARSLAASVGFSALLTRFTGQLSQVMTAGVSFAGAVATQRQKTLAANASFVGALGRRTSRAFTAALSFAGLVSRGARKGLSGGVSFAGGMVRVRNTALNAAVSFSGGLGVLRKQFFTAAVSFSGVVAAGLQWIQVQLAIVPYIHRLGHWAFRGIRHFRDQAYPTAIAPWWGIRSLVERAYYISITVKGPLEVAYKRGTNILFEATFTDRDGINIDPDTGTAKMYVKKPDGTYMTGFDPGVGGTVMNKISVGVYQGNVQFARTDAIGQYEIESEGKFGTRTTLDSIRINVRE